MSIRLMKAVLEDDTLTDATETLLMLALADHANDSGYCWPSITQLAKRARVSERQAQRLITKLIEDGRIEADRRGGRNRATLYRILAPQKGDTDDTLSRAKGDTDDTLSDSKRVSSKPKRVTWVTQKGDMGVTPTIIEPPIEPGSKRGGQPFSESGEGETQPDAPNVGAALPELPDEVLAAWDSRRWPITDKLAAFLRNAEQGFSRAELLTAISILNASPKQIDRPAAYLNAVLKRRMSAMVNDAPAPTRCTAQEEPSPAPRPQIARESPEVAAVRFALAEQLPVLAADVGGWPVAVEGQTVTVNAGHRADWLSRSTGKLQDSITAYLRRPVVLRITSQQM